MACPSHITPPAHPILRPPNPSDPTVSVKLYSWSSEEFREEHAVIYTSRSHPSETCICHWRSNRDKWLYTLQDSLCTGNPVRIDLEIQAVRDERGFAILKFKILNHSGGFVEETRRQGLSLMRYRDRFHHREAELQYFRIGADEVDIDFTSGLPGGPGLSYTISLHYHYLKGIDAELDGPECYFGHPWGQQTFIGYCIVEYVGGKPPSNVFERIMMNESKEEKGSIVDDGAASSSSSTTTRSAILNAGNTQGSLNGSNFTACKFDFGPLIKEAQGLSK